MATLLICLQGPMQSWGISSHFSERDTAREPSKSAVIGLICAALGRPRDADISDLVRLKMGVRVDREGLLEKDYQIAQNVFSADGKQSPHPVTSNRYYLADAAFLVGLEGAHPLLAEIYQALLTPKWQISLGRKAFLPALPLYLPNGLQSLGLMTALQTYPPLVENPEPEMRLVIEADDGEFTRKDVPINFASRNFGRRRVRMTSIKTPQKEGV